MKLSWFCVFVVFVCFCMNFDKRFLLYGVLSHTNQVCDDATIVVTNVSHEEEELIDEEITDTSTNSISSTVDKVINAK